MDYEKLIKEKEDLLYDIECSEKQLKEDKYLDWMAKSELNNDIREDKRRIDEIDRQLNEIDKPIQKILKP